jgi:hypothetical protein
MQRPARFAWFSRATGVACALPASSSAAPHSYRSVAAMRAATSPATSWAWPPSAAW